MRAVVRKGREERGLSMAKAELQRVEGGRSDDVCRPGLSGQKRQVVQEA